MRFGRAATLILAAALTLTACTPAEPMPTSAEDYAQQLFEDTNVARTAGGDLPPLTWSDCLATAALPRAHTASTEDTLEHQTLTATCLPGQASGENLSRGDHTPQQIVDMWMDSPGHRANIERAGFTIAGVGCVDMPDGQPGYTCSLLFEGGE
ncbi:CAP domain-containing protein [Demequina sp.]|uniref:CAP domain-containing protein n=1 Tax=Demequina sp. TaxID=2050685 RepID=UPI003D0F19DB